MLRNMVRRLMCRLGHCWRCRVYETPEGIGGKCLDCGKIHGWVTREELIAYAERDAAALRRDWQTVARDFGQR